MGGVWKVCNRLINEDKSCLSGFSKGLFAAKLEECVGRSRMTARIGVYNENENFLSTSAIPVSGGGYRLPATGCLFTVLR